jgi:hypothetical protein
MKAVAAHAARLIAKYEALRNQQVEGSPAWHLYEGIVRDLIILSSGFRSKALTYSGESS